MLMECDDGDGDEDDSDECDDDEDVSAGNYPFGTQQLLVLALVR